MADWLPIEELQINVDIYNFWKSVAILITKPFALNRYIGGCDLFNIETFSPEKIYELEKIVKRIIKSNLTDFHQIKYLLESNSIITKFTQSAFVELQSCGQESVIFLRVIFPRNGDFRLDIFDLVCCDFIRNIVTFKKLHGTNKKPNLLVDIPFQVKYSEGKLCMSVESNNQNVDSLNFLKFTLFRKLSTWMKSDLKSDQIYSLCLVEVDKYVVLYNLLKKKYFNLIKEIWTESTDVEKFVHEDIAIATYLILLWDNKPQNFMDLGCGNGLLVYILNNEGHNGVGLDVRARTIWTKYPPNTVLKVMPIVPSDSTLFPAADWIIGNHSDELTPWIPVIAFRSSPKTNFFIIPCCAYEFDGTKYSRKTTSKSQYLSYIDYVEEICRTCGFVTCRDRLRIPSTKRICLVSFGRTFSDSEQMQTEEDLMKLIRRKSTLGVDVSGKWLNFYKPREAKEKVRNCTQLSKNLIDDIVNNVSKLLLKDSLESWNEGTPMKLATLVELLPATLLSQLKKECGGIQTVLKNHHNIFQFENGMVKFRKPVVRKVHKEKWKKRNCWFYNNHPDSCPLTNETCAYIHEG